MSRDFYDPFGKCPPPPANGRPGGYLPDLPAQDPAIGLANPTKPTIRPGDWLASLSSEERKQVPLYSVLFGYFPDAMAALARHAFISNEKHNPGQPLHWSRNKSADHKDCAARHLAGIGTRDSDGQRHAFGLLWRAAAIAQLEIEEAVRRGEKI